MGQTNLVIEHTAPQVADGGLSVLLSAKPVKSLNSWSCCGWETFGFSTLLHVC